MSALERSKAELALYREQLGQINALVASDPANAQFLKLQADLHQVIALTVDLIAVAEAAKEKEATSSSGAYDPLSATDADFQADVDDLGQEDDEDEKGVEAFGVGSTVEALSGTSWYPAVIKSVSEDGQVFLLDYIGYSGEGESANPSATLHTLRQLKAQPTGLKKSQAVPGTLCLGLWAVDGQWYKCKIESVTERGLKVVFPEYGNSEEVPLAYLKHEEKVPAAPMDVKEKKPEDREFPKSALNPDGTFCIPDNLRLLPTDTDAEKDKKRRKVKSLKSRYKQMQKQQDTTSKQSSWQAFAGSTGKKRVKGSFAGVRKESIFKTPDNLEGRVGVVGSGKGVTEFEAKKRYKMNL